MISFLFVQRKQDITKIKKKGKGFGFPNTLDAAGIELTIFDAVGELVESFALLL